MNADVATSRVASCNAGEHATGGGFAYVSGAPLDVSVLNSEPVFDVSGVPTGWVISVFNRDEDNDNMGTISMTASVICASP